MRGVAALALVLGSLAAAGCGNDDDDAGAGDAQGEGEPVRLVVSAAASMTDALEACAPEFGEQENVDVKLNLAGSDELAAQIRQGVEPDVYAAANTRIPDELYAEDLIDKPVEFATNEFVLAVPADSGIESVSGVAKDGTKIAVGSESVPIGSYTREALAKLPPAQERSLLANIRSNEPDVKGIVGKVVQGAAEAGFVYLTDVTATGGELRAVELPPAVEPEVTYAAAVVKGAPRPEQGREFVDGLADGVCADALREAGFGAVE